jgi:adenosylcobinamide amidohydrolase
VVSTHVWALLANAALAQRQVVSVAVQLVEEAAFVAQVVAHAGTWDSTPGTSTDAVASVKLKAERRTMVLLR